MCVFIRYSHIADPHYSRIPRLRICLFAKIYLEPRNSLVALWRLSEDSRRSVAPHTIPAEGERGHALPAWFGPHPVNMCLPCHLFSAVFFAFLGSLSVNFMFGMFPECSAARYSQVQGGCDVPHGDMLI